MKKEIAPSTEARFQLTFTVRARYLGDIMALLDKKTEAFDINLVKELSSEKNIPKGSTSEAIMEVLKRNKGKMEYKPLVAAVVNLGYPKTAFYAAIQDLIKEKKSVKRVVNTIIIK